MKSIIYALIALGLTAAPFSHAEENWQKLSFIFPGLEGGTESFSNKLTNREGLIVEGGPAAQAVGNNFGNSEAGWWWGIRAASGGTSPTFNTETDILTINTSSAADGSLVVAKSNFFTSSELISYNSLKFSIDFASYRGGNGSQKWNLSLWYSLSNEQSVTKIGSTITNSGVNLANTIQSWNFDTSVLESLSENGGYIYMVINSNANPSGYHELDISGISMEGLVPEPATASLGLFGLAALMIRRRRV